MSSPQEAAKELLDVVPIVMKEIRTEMRSRRTPDLSVPQFRALNFIDVNKGASLSAVANHIGLTLPSASRLIDVLMTRRLLKREDNPADRRRVKLSVTNRGLIILEASRRGTLNHLAKKLGSVTAEERQTIIEALKTIGSVFMCGVVVKTATK